MMKKVLNILIIICLFLATFIMFLPKESLYNFAEKELEKYQIIVSNEQRDEKIFSLDVLNGKLYFEGINIGNIEKISFSTLLLYSKIDLQNLNFLNSFSSFAPSPVSSISLKHTILNFNKIYIDANGAFGDLNGYFDIFKGNLKIELNASQIMKDSYFKLLKDMKFENGVYIYEYKF